jgi:peroxiredoxin
MPAQDLGSIAEWRYTMKLEVGMPAPDFELMSHLDDVVTLSEYRGRHHVVLAFFPLAWTPV